MALPHYKLHTYDEATLHPQDTFPVLLAPMDPPQKFARLKQFLRSRKLLIVLEIVSLAAGGAWLWLLLDPTIKTPPVYGLSATITLGVCLTLLLVIALVKNRSAAPEPVEVETADELPPPSLVKPARTMLARPERRALSSRSPVVEMDCEEWSSEPYVELLEDTIITEVFDDELIAPDHMVFCVKVPD